MSITLPDITLPDMTTPAAGSALTEVLTLGANRSDSLYDALTGLANADLFGAMLHAARCRAERSGHSGAVVLAAIDRRSGEDSVTTDGLTLRAVAARLKQVMRRADFVARVGPQSFAVLISDQAYVDIDQVLRKVRNTFSVPVEREDGLICFPRIVAHGTLLSSG